MHNLKLELGSNQRPTGAPSAEHIPPAGLQAGPSLPLVSPERAPATGTTTTSGKPNPGTAKGRMLIYWSCGENAPAPIVIDMANLSSGKAMANLPVINVNMGTPPSADRNATFGHWPNERGRTSVPAQGSLVGEHTVRGNYSPEIKFSLGAGQDFMAPLQTTASASPGGGKLVSWNAVPNATGYFAQVVGSAQNGDLIMWSSSGTAASFGYLMDYVPPSEVRRLIGQKVVMAPSTTQCIVPSQVVKAVSTPMLMMVAYGDEVNVAHPPRPANAKTPTNIDWTTKVRYRSTTTAMLGMSGAGGGH
jgi:hypothetical protein